MSTETAAAREPDAAIGRCVVIGAGPAGLTAAHELSKLGIEAVIFEKDDVVGGIARTANYKGYRFDIGGHRFFTKVESVQRFWSDMLGADFLLRPRLSRIYYNGKFFDYPLKIGNALRGVGPFEAARIGFSFLSALISPSKPERTFEQWVTNRFGRRLYQIFFESYTEKVWGIPCSEIGSDWAAQRIKNLDLFTAVKDALLQGTVRRNVVTSLIEEFHYPRLGPGMMWQRCMQQLSDRGIHTHFNTEIVRIQHRNECVESVTVRDHDGNEREERASQFISSMPLRELIHALHPAAPQEIVAAADRLRYRDFLTVVLIVDKPDLFPDQWIYVHSSEVLVGRVQNFKNWSPEMVPNSSHSTLGLEYFLWDTDDLWSLPDAELVSLGQREAAKIGLISEADVIDGCVVRMPKAYPVYDASYRDAVATLRAYIEKFPNLESVGRNGQHRYNNQDHSMVTAMYAVENIAGSNRDCWDVNVEEDYHEEVTSKRATGDRLVPSRVLSEVEEDLIRSVFARYDPVALGGALGVVLGLSVFLATAVLLVQEGEHGASLSLLGNYLLGFQFSWGGALLGLGEASVGGFGGGYMLARLLNAVIGSHERGLLKKIERLRAMDIASEDWS